MTFNLEYNSERNHLVIPEYGRHVQKMVEHCLEEKDKDKRSKMAQATVEVMASIHPNHRDAQRFSAKIMGSIVYHQRF